MASSLQEKAKKKIFPLQEISKKRKKKRFKPGTVALREIRKYQKTTKLCFQ